MGDREPRPDRALQILGERATFVRLRTGQLELDETGAEPVRHEIMADTLERIAELAGGEARAVIGEDRWQAHVAGGGRLALVASWPAGNAITKSVQRLLRRIVRGRSS